jgi:hypothetical protein
MADKFYPKSNLPIRRSVELLPVVFQTDANDKFLAGVLDPLVQPGVLDKVVGYTGRRYGKTYNGKDVYVDSDATLRSRYQLEPGVIYRNQDKIENFYDYIDFKNQLKFFGNLDERDDKITSQEHYSWNPPIEWDKFINYREYYWEPSGPPSVAIFGQSAAITSTYKVVLGATANSFIFTPDAATNNPTLTLYRGQTYKFKVDVPGERLFIRTNYDTGSLTFKPYYAYAAGQQAVYDNKLWRARVNISPADGSSITLDSQDWELLESISTGTALDYNKGVTNNGVENGTLTFTVPYDAPDVLFYQGAIDPDRFGRFLIADIESNTNINIDKDVLGKSTYTSSNGVTLTNGLVIEFKGNVTPSKYASNTWLVEGVGTAITLTRFSDLIVPVLTTDVPEVLFDGDGFDSQPFDDAAAYPTYKDYITIARNSIDANPWSRYNRWFHRSVLEYAYQSRGQDFSAAESARAKRPIIEFSANLQLFNHGSTAKETVDYIDTFTDDVFSKIEGSTGYNVDGEFLFEGARLLVVADTDPLVNNKIYQIQFIKHNNTTRIHLAETDDSESVNGEGVLVRRGIVNSGIMFHYNGTAWVLSQKKNAVQQAPLFDIFDSNGISFADPDTYPVSTFVGSPLLGYKLGNGRVDTELGFALSYLNIDNVGDIQFNWNWDTDLFYYTVDRVLYNKKIAVGYYKFNPNDNYDNGWTKTATDFIQPIIDSAVITETTTKVSLNTLKWSDITDESLLTINFYLNGKKLNSTYTRDQGVFTFDQPFVKNDVISVKIITDQIPADGYYQIPLGLEKNPLNADLTTFTLGQAIDHVFTSLEFNNEISGDTPGASNLRDIAGYQQHATRFLKHSGLAPLTTALLCDKTHNIIKSIQYAKKAYTDFKNNFLAKAIEIPYNDNNVNFVDDIILELTKTKTTDSPFSDSDVIGCGAYTAINYSVEDTGIKTFSLTTKFGLDELSRRAVYVYLNQHQLLNSRDYEFNSTFGFVDLLIDLTEGDEVEIREYVSTASCHVPPTPSSMGLYKKYTPMKFIDDTYAEPREVIQGHDGSITFAYGDFRDDLLLELEYRIYNNIKSQYDPAIFDIDAIVGGYYGVGLYNKSQLDSIVNQEFLKWIQNTNINYTLNTYLDTENTFTYTYSNMSDPTGTKNLPGYWRGVYKWFYDTDRPHRCPWEMLGFSEQPTWWTSIYGPAPYTSNNLILWEDIRDGVIRQGSRAGRYDRYARLSILEHIPVDGDGNLLSPLDSGLARDFSLINNKGPFVLGDISPVEYAWRSSSEWPFAVVLAMCLMKPFEFITDSFDLSKTKLNLLNQTVNIETDLFTTLADITVPTETSELATGLVRYLVSYIKSRGIAVDSIQTKISNLDVALSTRLSGFVDQEQQKYLLDSKSPSATSSSIFVPAENYDIIFNISSPIASVTYSGVILEKTDMGWIVTGYDDINPFFSYYAAMPNQRDPLISVGGVSENFVDWTTNRTYSNGALIRNSNDFYRAIKTHDSGSAFDLSQWKKLPGVPKVGAVEAFRRKSFNTLSIKQLSYGSVLSSVQQVVDFLLGYEAYLKSQGFTFDRYDPDNQVSQDWLSSSKEFMFWTKHNWSIGSIITLSPAAQKVDVTVPVGVADNILDGFYDYQVLKSDGKPLAPRFINVNRSFQNLTVETTNTVEGIFYLKLYYVLKEHVTVFDDRTVFNDIIYDKTTGYRQERIKTQGYRTTDWDGDYTSPGFLFDNVNIQTWQPFTDYRLGDIVAYKSYNWTSLKNQLGTESFSDTFWRKLDTTPKKQLVANLDYKIKEFSDFYEVASEGISEDQRALARHAIGYQQRDYLQNLSEDPVTQFQLYQGFIREKGTANAITKVFDKLSRSSDSITLDEEWAFRTGRFGGTQQLTELEIQLVKNNFEVNPQPVLIEQSVSKVKVDQYYRITGADFTISPIPYSTDINPVSLDVEPTIVPGYVKLDQIEHIIQTKEDLTSLDISAVNENDHIWVTFDNTEWSVYRLNETPSLLISSILRPSDTTVSITLNRPHNLLVGDYIGIRDLANLTGFFKIVETASRRIDVEVDAAIQDPEIDESSRYSIHLLNSSRVENYQELGTQQSALLKNGSKIFVDNNGDNLWEVVEKQQQYFSKTLGDYGIANPVGTGTKVIYDNNLKHTLASIPRSGYVMCYAETADGLILKQIISPPVGIASRVSGSFGEKMAISPDSKFLIVGSPSATDVPSSFRGEWSAADNYAINDIVLYAGRLWRATNSTFADGSTDLNVYSGDWELTSNIPATASGVGTGYYQQGMISIYQYRNNKYEISASFVSPRPADNEKFGSEISIGLDNGVYYLAVSAIGSYNNTGRVYLYSFNGIEWEHLENPNYRGVYNPLETYRAGDIVWQASQDPIAEGVRGNLWQALDGSTTDGSTLTIESSNWLKVSDISTHCSLPTNIALEDDGSTLEFAYTGALSNLQIAEIIKQGDQFGFSTAMSRDASILVVGSPYSDGQYFANYRGVWRPDVEYTEGEVVKRAVNDPPSSYIYYRLEDNGTGIDSTARSYNEDPSDSDRWTEISDSTSDPSGKIFVYKRSSYGSYELTQMINSGSLPSFIDTDSGITITTGDEFGFALDIDASGDTLVVSSPKSDINFQDQGSVYVLSRDTSATLEYRLVQKLQSFEQYPAEYFGYSVSVSPDTAKIVVGARNAPSTLPIFFDMFTGTSFDNSRTRFYEDQGFSGGVYVFDKKDQTYHLTEKLQDVLTPNESFGSSVDCVGSIIAVGSPDYNIDGQPIGNVRLFKKSLSADSWSVVSQQAPVVDIRKIRSIELYDNVNNVKIQDIDYIDPAKGKILNIAEKEIKFKTPYDPAVYSIGTNDQVVDSTINWLEKNVGMLWWNLSTAKWVHYEQGDAAYRKGNWSQLATGASIDVYEWIETPLLPNEWAALADTNEGIAQGISGQPLYPNNNVYSVKQFINESTGLVNNTLYYYWVKNKAVVPTNMPSRARSAAEVASLIANPTGSGIAFLSLIDSDKFVTYNFDSVLSADTALLNIQYLKNFNKLNPIHNEYQLLTEGVADSLPTAKLENKWIDSLVGSDMQGNRVPDTKLPAKQKYGIEYRPRQGMFIDRLPALRTVVENVNTILKTEAFADVIDFRNLNLTDPAPNAILNLYDVVVDTYADLSAVGTVRTKQAILSANIVEGELDTIDIVDPGFGYRVVPPVVLDGDGTGARAEVTLDNQGRIASVSVINRGKRYSTILATVRNFSVLVVNDITVNNFWSIYAWDNVRRVFFRSQSQAFDTTRYWSLVDWWETGYGITSRIVKEVNSITETFSNNLQLGDLVRIKEFANGGWAVFEKISDVGDTFSDQYSMVGREKGTIELDRSLWDTTVFGIGFDNTQSFDNTSYDIENAKELRNILKAIKEDICIGDYAAEWNKIFFACIRYVFAEQQYVDWAFKTSFLNATHNVGSLDQKLNYKNDNLESYQDYINEVKPYRTTVREYVSKYDTVEPYGAAVADFDLPATYSDADGTVVPIATGRPELNQYPWKWWADNNGYSVIDIQVYASGEQYTTAPRVLIEGNGTGATAQAYISNGRVSGIRVLTEGSGYTAAPTVTLVGGNPGGVANARAVAIIGNSKARTFDITIKYDRVAKEGTYSSFDQNQTFTANGLTAVFELNYAPTRDKSKISILKNDQVVLNSEYLINLYYSSTDTYQILRGKVVFTQAPAAGDIINIVYEKNDELLDAVNRIEKYYAPVTGMRGKELNQLMTGVDFGGVQIQGTTFDVTGGWDALPWFTDNWDSVESNADYYVVVDLPIVDGSTGASEYLITLPFTPQEGQQITVYLKRVTNVTFRNIDTLGPDTAPVVELTEGSTGVTTVRIDDPNYSASWDSSVVTNPNAQMPTIIGDGVTKVINIGQYIELQSGDILIFRPIESDGSVTITDPNLLDTRLSGGSLAAINSAYSTATGTTAEEIVINGGKFIQPEHVPAPEENVPGQVLDSVSIKVFHNSVSGAAPLQSKISTSNGVTLVYPIGQQVIENTSVLVYVDKIIKTFGIDYVIDLKNYTITFIAAPTAGAIVEILSLGIGGLELLDYQEFIADGATTLFLTNANYNDTASVFVTQNGISVDVGFKNSTEVVDAVGKTLVEFPFTPSDQDVIKIVCLKAGLDTDSSGVSIVKINKQTFEFEGSTRSFDLIGFTDLSRGSSISSMIVEVNGVALKGVDTTYFKYDGVTNQFTLGVDPEEPAGSILPANIKVFVNDTLTTFIQDYVYDGTTKILTIDSESLTLGDTIKIENDYRAEYSIVGNNVIIDSTVNLESVNELDNDIIEITWFSEYPSMDIVTDEFTGGKVNYKLSSIPLSVSYVWVYKNGVRLTQDTDFYISQERGTIYLTENTLLSDNIKIIQFGSNIYRLPSAFEIHKDMLNFYHYKRFSKGAVKLTKALNYYDTQIEVDSAESLSEPIQSRNIPGIVYINNEKIEYMVKTGNVLSQLRRGSYGTSISEIYDVGSDVVDAGSQETIPYNETQDRDDFVSDGSSLLVGPLNFIPTQGSRNSWYTATIPETYGPCDQIEVFAAGRRLRKDPVDVYQEANGATSPAADIQLEAEFSVDGVSSYIRLTDPLPAGTRITVIKRTGKTWYDRGETTASTGVTLLENTTAIATFIAQKSTSLPE